MTKALSEREIILAVLLDVTEHDVYSHIALGNVLEKYQYLDKKERAFITRVTEGTLEHMIELDYILDSFSKVKTKKMKPVIRNLLRSAVYQLKYMDTVPDSAVCNEAVKLAVKKGFGSLRGFVNGVLRNVARGLDDVVYPDQPLLELSVRYSMPEWILQLWLAQYSKETVEQMLKDFQTERPVTIRCNQSKITENELETKLKEQGVDVKPHPYLPYAYRITGYNYLKDLESFRQGLFTVQDVSSMLVAEIAAPVQGDYVIDVCAAPGGKSLHMADKLDGTGHVEARDLTPYKTAMIQENIKRIQMDNITAVLMDATVLDESSIESADIVLADLPCSGLGVLGKKTDLKYKTTLQQTQELVQLQRDILNTVCAYVKQGGTMIYSTCTINEEENEKNVAWFLEQHPEFVVDEWSHLLCNELQGNVDANGCLQLLPGIHDSDGFFIVRLKKKGFA